MSKFTKAELLSLNPNQVNQKLLLSPDMIFHIFRELGGFWAYNYDVAEHGRVGLHAELKSGRCSDGFLNSKIVLKHPNIRTIMARQLVLRYNESGLIKPDWVAGIPDGATKLGEDVARIMGVKSAEMIKKNGKIKITTVISPGETLLLVEDFCTKGTGFKEAVEDIISKQSGTIIVPIELVIIIRGGLKNIQVNGADGTFKIVATAEHRINDWDPAECPLCKMGSGRIKPKAIEGNWEKIMTSQYA